MHLVIKLHNCKVCEVWLGVVMFGDEIRFNFGLLESECKLKIVAMAILKIVNDEIVLGSCT